MPYIHLPTTAKVVCATGPCCQGHSLVSGRPDRSGVTAASTKVSHCNLEGDPEGQLNRWLARVGREAGEVTAEVHL